MNETRQYVQYVWFFLSKLATLVRTLVFYKSNVCILKSKHQTKMKKLIVKVKY